MSILTAEQHDFYNLQGYLLISGLIPDAVSAAAQEAMERHLAASSERISDEAALVNSFTPEYCAAAAELGGGEATSYPPPRRAYIINVLPTSGEWVWPRPHIDHAIKEHGHHVFPRAFRIASMIYLSDVPPHGGGTVVWPGSHKRIEQLALSDPTHYELMYTLNQDLKQLDLGEPLELTPQRGDVLFYHYLCAHAGSMNVSDRPRLAFNNKW